MLRLVLDEFQKLKRSWVLLVAPHMFLMAPLLGVLTAKANSNNDPERITFDFKTIFTQVQLDSTILIAPLLMGTIAVYLVNREYQERTLSSLLTVPIRQSHLVGAKSIVVLLLGVLGALLGAIATVPLSFLIGSPSFEWGSILEGSFRMIFGNALVMPCVLLLVIVVLVSRNYLIAVSFSFVAIIFGMVALNISEFCYFVPWVAPTILSVDASAIESLGLEKSELFKSAATYTVFAVAVTVGLLATIERQAE